MASNVGTVNVNLAYGRCKDCKWWNADDRSDETGRAPEFRTVEVSQRRCECPSIIDMSCSCPSEGKLWCELAANEAGYTDREGYGAHFRTGPEFGCIHWEAK